MKELQDFIYELHRYADQTHILKDAYERLNDEAKQKLMALAPDSLRTPSEYFNPVYEWLEAVNKNLVE